MGPGAAGQVAVFDSPGTVASSARLAQAASGQLDVQSASSGGYGSYGIHLLDTATGGSVVLQPTPGAVGLYLTDSGGNPAAMTLGVRRNPYDGSTFEALPGAWRFSKDKLEVGGNINGSRPAQIFALIEGPSYHGLMLKLADAQSADPIRIETAAGTAVLTMHPDGVPTAPTDIATKAYVDARALSPFLLMGA